LLEEIEYFAGGGRQREGRMKEGGREGSGGVEMEVEGRVRVARKKNKRACSRGRESLMGTPRTRVSCPLLLNPRKPFLRLLYVARRYQ
jgi:hypothetical protein